MRIIVLVKHAMITDFRPDLRVDGKGFDPASLIFEMNDWDRYALEEAIKLKEGIGAEVTAISVGTDCDATLRKCLAAGVDRVAKLPFDSVDSWQIAEAISQVVAAQGADLILAGYQSQDLNNALVGPLLAGMLDLPCATAVVAATYHADRVSVRRELEGGVQEEVTLPLPCLLTIQTGINVPRHISTSRMMKAKKEEIPEVHLSPKPASFEIARLFYPETKKGETIEGSAGEITDRLIALLEERSVL
jgi:electron transfer flavoprotein beta subunit